MTQRGSSLLLLGLAMTQQSYRGISLSDKALNIRNYTLPMNQPDLETYETSPKVPEETKVCEMSIPVSLQFYITHIEVYRNLPPVVRLMYLIDFNINIGLLRKMMCLFLYMQLSLDVFCRYHILYKTFVLSTLKFYLDAIDDIYVVVQEFQRFVEMNRYFLLLK